MAQHHVGEADFARLGTVYQMGLLPRRIDVLTQISGVEFDEAQAEQASISIGGNAVAFLGILALIKNKRAAGRAKDLLDVELLERRQR